MDTFSVALCMVAAIAHAQPTPTSGTAFAVTVRSETSNAGVRKAAVSLRSNMPNGPTYDGLTDDAGAVRFKVVPGLYRVRAEKVGFVALEPDRLAVISADQGSSVAVQLTPLGSISGTVADEDGEALPQVEIQVLQAEYWRGRRTFKIAATGESDIAGGYSIPGLTPGSFFVRAIAASKALPKGQVFTPTFYPGGIDESMAAPVAISPGGQLRGIDLRLQAAKARTISGHAFAPDGSPGKGMMILYGTRTGTTSSMRVGVRTANDGSYQINDVPPARYYVTALLPNSRTGSQAPSYDAQVDVTEGDASDVNLYPAKPAHLVVQVRSADEQQPIKGLSISLESLDSLSWSHPKFTRTESGIWETKDSVNAGRYAVDVSGIPSGLCLGAVKFGANENAGEVNLVGQSELDLTLEQDCGSVTGQGFPGAQIVLAPESQRSFDFHSVAVSESGAWTISQVLPGKYTLFVFRHIPNGAWLNSEFMQQHDNAGLKISVGKRQQLTIEESELSVIK